MEKTGNDFRDEVNRFTQVVDQREAMALQARVDMATTRIDRLVFGQALTLAKALPSWFQGLYEFSSADINLALFHRAREMQEIGWQFDVDVITFTVSESHHIHEGCIKIALLLSDIEYALLAQ